MSPLRYLFSGVCSFLLFGAQLHAQYDSTDHTYEEVVVPAEADEYDATEKDEPKKNSFLLKSETDNFSVKERKIQESQIKKMKEDDAFWYADADITQKIRKEETPQKAYTPLGQQPWFKTIMWIIIVGGFVAALIWYLASNNAGLFRRKQHRQNEAVAEAEEETDIFSINYQRDIERAAAAGNYRLAVRLMYLRMLKIMAERNIIQYKQDKTNFDYLLQLHPTSYYNDFFRLTRNYEYSWYGQFDVSETAYQVINRDFNQFEKKFI